MSMIGRTLSTGQPRLVFGLCPSDTEHHVICAEFPFLILINVYHLLLNLFLNIL